jgi:hypothetical protein
MFVAPRSMLIRASGLRVAWFRTFEQQGAPERGIHMRAPFDAMRLVVRFSWSDEKVEAQGFEPSRQAHPSDPARAYLELPAVLIGKAGELVDLKLPQSQLTAARGKSQRKLFV